MRRRKVGRIWWAAGRILLLGGEKEVGYGFSKNPSPASPFPSRKKYPSYSDLQGILLKGDGARVKGSCLRFVRSRLTLHTVRDSPAGMTRKGEALLSILNRQHIALAPEGQYLLRNPKGPISPCRGEIKKWRR
ncbi:MAG: hypothetical protein AAF824_21555 [Bacteroidota bacterium]